MWKSSQKLVTQRPAVSCIAWLGVCIAADELGTNATERQSVGIDGERVNRVEDILERATRRRQQRVQECEHRAELRRRPVNANGKVLKQLYDRRPLHLQAIRVAAWIRVVLMMTPDDGRITPITVYLQADIRSRPVHACSLHLTRPRSATAGESERGLQWTCVHNVKRGSTPASGWLHRLVRPWARETGGL